MSIFVCPILIFVAGLALPCRSLWDGSAAARAYYLGLFSIGALLVLTFELVSCVPSEFLLCLEHLLLVLLCHADRSGTDPLLRAYIASASSFVGALIVFSFVGVLIVSNI